MNKNNATERDISKDFEGQKLTFDLFRFGKNPLSQDNGADGQEGQVEDENRKEAEVKTYTEEEVQKKIQSESDKRVTEALKTAKENWKKELEEEEKEKQRLAKLSEKERVNEDLQKKEKEIAELNAKLNLVNLERDTEDRLAEENIPREFKTFLMGSDAESTNENIKAFKPIFEDLVQKQVEERLKGKTPSGASKGDKPDAWSILRDKYK